MKLRLVLLVLIAAALTLRADDKIANVQQQLKEQGFYYGDITGEKNADTTAAIRRFQIRNGLQITGELNDETLRSLKGGAASASASKMVTPPPASTPDTSDLRDNSPRERADANPPPTRPYEPPAQQRQVPLPDPDGVAPPPVSGLLTGTPYENAPPDVQRDVIVRVQKSLARRGLFRNEIDGVYGPNLQFSLRAYQSRVGLQPTGRLDLGTLAALELLPGADTPVYTPRRVLRPRRDFEPPVRGEWIRP
jgi:peptidoglycan hydrolase-like protein with peptidoglycan-binding domain